MKKVVSLLLVFVMVLALAGCTNSTRDNGSDKNELVDTSVDSGPEDVEEVDVEEVEPLEVSVKIPYGTPALSMVKLLVEEPDFGENVTVDYELIQATDVLSAALINQEADIAIVPTNLAATIYNKGVPYKLAGSSVWGVLYLVSNEEITSVEELKGKDISLIGRNLTPDAMLRYVLSENGIDPETDVNLEYFSGSSELATNYISGNSNLGMIPQPLLTNVLMKRDDSKVVIDLQEEWIKLTGSDSFPQASIIVSEELLNNNPDFVEAFLAEFEAGTKWINENPAEAGAYYESLGIGLNAKIIEKAIPQCNIRYQSAADAREALDTYLNVLFEFNPQLLGGVAIEEGFYAK